MEQQTVPRGRLHATDRSPASGPRILVLLSGCVLAWPVALGALRGEEKWDRKWHQGF